MPHVLTEELETPLFFDCAASRWTIQWGRFSEVCSWSAQHSHDRVKKVIEVENGIEGWLSGQKHGYPKGRCGHGAGMLCFYDILISDKHTPSRAERTERQSEGDEGICGRAKETSCGS